MSVVLMLMLMPASLVRTGLKGEGHSRKLTFFVFVLSKYAFSFSTFRSAHYPEEIRREGSASKAKISVSG